MEGDAKRRFCNDCRLHVYNLDAMTPAEREDLLSVEGRKCVAYVAPDRSIQVRTSLWLMLERLRRGWQAVAALVAVIVPLGATGCATAPPPSCPAAKAKVHDGKEVKEPHEKAYVGGITSGPSRVSQFDPCYRFMWRYR
jgi:hypothetical protein